MEEKQSTENNLSKEENLATGEKLLMEDDTSTEEISSTEENPLTKENLSTESASSMENNLSSETAGAEAVDWSKWKKFFPVAVIAIALLAVVAVWSGVNSNKINLEDYIADEIVFKGYEGYGTVETSKNDIVDFETLLSDLGATSTDLSVMWGGELILNECISIDYTSGEAPGNLKNGDKVEYTITVDYDLINNSDGFKKKLKGKDSIQKSYKVSGLGEIAEINPFDAIEKVLVSEGYSDYEVTYQFSDKIENYECSAYTTGYSFDIGENTISCNFVAPEISDIHAGDTITISLGDDADTYAKSYGILFSQTSQEFSVFTVEDVTSASQITETSYNILKALFENKAQSAEDGEYTFVDMYFLSEKGIIFSANEKIIAIYKYKSNAVGSSDEYIYFYIESPQIASDGEIVVTAGVYIKNNSTTDIYNTAEALEEELASSYTWVTVTAFDKITF